MIPASTRAVLRWSTFSSLGRGFPCVEIDDHLDSTTELKVLTCSWGSLRGEGQKDLSFLKAQEKQIVEDL